MVGNKGEGAGFRVLGPDELSLRARKLAATDLNDVVGRNKGLIDMVLQVMAMNPRDIQKQLVLVAESLGVELTPEMLVAVIAVIGAEKARITGAAVSVRMPAQQMH